jgi:hypothetical protein
MAVVAFVLAVGALAYRVHKALAPPRRAPVLVYPPAGPKELAIVAPLHVGAALGDCTVQRIDAVHDGAMDIGCTCGPMAATLHVALAAAEGKVPPVTAGPYAIYYSSLASAGDMTPLCLSLAKLLEANAATPVPPGLGPYLDQPNSGDDVPQGSHSIALVPAGPAELAMIAPLNVDSKIGDCKIRRIAVDDGTLAVTCGRGAAAVTLQVALLSPGSPPPPATSGRYAVYYSAARSAGDLSPLCVALAHVLDANASVPPAPGLRAFRGALPVGVDGGVCADPDGGGAP